MMSQARWYAFSPMQKDALAASSSYFPLDSLASFPLLSDSNDKDSILYAVARLRLIPHNLPTLTYTAR